MNKDSSFDDRTYTTEEESSKVEHGSTVISNPGAILNEGEVTGVELSGSEVIDDEAGSVKEPIEAMEIEDSVTAPPHIPLRLKFTVLLFGLSSRLSWNMVINAAGYYRIRLLGTSFENSFPNYIQATSVVCNLVGSAANVVLSKRINIGTLSVGSCATQGVFIGIICLLSFLDTGSWAEEFFIVNLGCMLFLAFGHSILTSNMNAILTMFSPPLIVWFYMGKGLAAIVAVIITVVTVSFPFLNIETAAFWFFLIATVFILLFVTSLMFRFIRLPEIKRTTCTKKPQQVSDINDPPIQKPMKTLELLKSGWQICAAAYCLMFTSLCIYPALTTNIRESSPDPDSAWSSKYFQPVAIFLMFAVGDISGKTLSGYIKVPSCKYLPVIIAIRVILIPLILMCNIQPRTWPVWFKSEVFASIFTFITGITSGWFLTLVLVYTPLYVEGKVNQGRLSTVVYLFLAAGMSTASCIIFGLSAMINV